MLFTFSALLISQMPLSSLSRDICLQYDGIHNRSEAYFFRNVNKPPLAND